MEPISFPVTLTYTNSNLQFDPIFTLVEDSNPIKQLQQFCHGYGLMHQSCRTIGAYLVQRMIDEDMLSENEPLGTYQDDTIVGISDYTRNAYYSPPTAYDEIYVDLIQLNGGALCDTLYIPVDQPDVDVRVAELSSRHGLKGIRAQELTYAVWSYRNCLYGKPDGVTLLNLIDGMNLPKDLKNMYFLVDVVNVQTKELGRVYFQGTSTYFASEVEKFCKRHGMQRVECHQLYEYVHGRLNEYFEDGETELANALYVSYVIESLVEQRRNNGDTADTIQAPIAVEQDDGVRTDLDFIEIGTSNFNTISQLLDATDPLVGLAVEPYAAYLAQLPARPGVTKVNAAIVSEADALRGTGTVDMYYIPEEVVDSLKLSPFIKGCNSIGRMHAMHTAVGYEAYVQVQPVSAVSIRQLLTSHRVRRIRLLKIDAEGYDSTIMHELYLYLVARGDPALYPERIVFESGEKSQQAFIAQTVRKFVELGYVIAFNTGDDIALQYGV